MNTLECLSCGKTFEEVDIDLDNCCPYCGSEEIDEIANLDKVETEAWES